MKRFFTKKHLLSLTLALLLIMVLLGAGFLLIPRPTTRWTFQAPGYVDSVFSPIESRGLLYILLQQPGLNYTAYALDASSGQVRWSFNIQGLIDTAPIVANGLLYVLAGSTVDRQSTLYALDAASGREQWSYQQALLSPPTIVNSIVYIHSGNGTLYAFNALTGDQLWSVPIGDNPFDTPIVANNLVYMVAGNGGKPESTVFALDAASGHTSWSLVVRSHYFSQLAVANGLVYLAPVSADAQVLALDAFSGTTRWSVQLAHQSEDANFLYTVSSFQVVNGIAYVDYQGMDPTSSTIGPGALSAH